MSNTFNWSFSVLSKRLRAGLQRDSAVKGKEGQIASLLHGLKKASSLKTVPKHRYMFQNQKGFNMVRKLKLNYEFIIGVNRSKQKTQKIA